MNSPVLTYKKHKIFAMISAGVVFICLSACTVMANCVETQNSLFKTNKGESTDVKKPHTQRCEVNLQRSLGYSPEETGGSQ